MAVGEERLRQFPEEQLEGAGDDVHVLPLAVLQVQFLCAETKSECVSGQQVALGAAGPGSTDMLSKICEDVAKVGNLRVQDVSLLR